MLGERQLASDRGVCFQLASWSGKASWKVAPLVNSHLQLASNANCTGLDAQARCVPSIIHGRDNSNGHRECHADALLTPLPLPAPMPGITEFVRILSDFTSTP